MTRRLRERWATVAATAAGGSALDYAQLAAALALVATVFAIFAHRAVTHVEPRTINSAAFTAMAPAAEKRPGGAHRAAIRRGTWPPAARRLPPVAGASLGRAAPPGPAGERRPAQTTEPRRPPARAPSRRPRPGRPPVAAAPHLATPVVVAVVYQASDESARLGAALELHAEAGDVAAQAAAVAAWVNAHGGIAGRPLALRPVAFEAGGARSFGAAFAGACTALAGAALKPVAVVARLDHVTAQAGCLAARDLPLIGDGPAPGDSQLFAQFADHLFAPGSMAVDRLAGAYVRSLLREGFLTRGSRVGVLHLEGAEYERAVARAVRPPLRAAGVPVAAAAAIPRAHGAADAPALLARVAAAALRFRAAGVDRVLILDAGIATAPFMRAAEALAYRPRYGLNSTMAPAALAGRVPAAQLHGAHGVGLAPLLDVSAGHEPEPAAGRRRCEEIYRLAGVATGGRPPGGRYAAIAVCDAVLFVRAALDGAGEATTGALRAGLEALGDRRPSALALATALGRERHDGAAVVRPLRYDAGCACLRYTGPAETAP